MTLNVKVALFFFVSVFFFGGGWNMQVTFIIINLCDNFQAMIELSGN